MGKYSGILLCCDFDGTLSLGGEISPENAAAIRHFQAEGGRFTMASGRYPRFFHDFRADFCPNAPIVALGGSVIYQMEEDRCLYFGTLEEEAYMAAQQIWNDFPAIYLMQFFDFEHSYPLRRETGETFADYRLHLPADCCKFVMMTRQASECEALRDALTERFGSRFTLGRSWATGLELQNEQDSKGAAILRLRAMLGNEIEQIVCIGDYENDISMFAIADRSFAVAGGSPMAIAAAGEIAPPCAEHAVAAVIAAL